MRFSDGAPFEDSPGPTPQCRVVLVHDPSGPGGRSASTRARPLRADAVGEGSGATRFVGNPVGRRPVRLPTSRPTGSGCMTSPGPARAADQHPGDGEHGRGEGAAQIQKEQRPPGLWTNIRPGNRWTGVETKGARDVLPAEDFQPHRGPAPHPNGCTDTRDRPPHGSTPDAGRTVAGRHQCRVRPRERTSSACPGPRSGGPGSVGAQNGHTGRSVPCAKNIHSYRLDRTNASPIAARSVGDAARAARSANPIAAAVASAKAGSA